MGSPWAVTMDRQLVSGCRRGYWSQAPRSFWNDSVIIGRSSKLFWGFWFLLVRWLLSWDRISCCPGWPQTHCIAEAGLKLLVPLSLPLSPKFWDYRHTPQHLAFKHSLKIVVLWNRRDDAEVKSICSLSEDPSSVPNPYAGHLKPPVTPVIEKLMLSSGIHVHSHTCGIYT